MHCYPQLLGKFEASLDYEIFIFFFHLVSAVNEITVDNIPETVKVLAHSPELWSW